MLLTGLFTLALVVTSSYQAVDFEAVLAPIDYFDPQEYLIGPGDAIWLTFPGGVPFADVSEPVSEIVIPVALGGVLTIPGLPQIDTNGMSLYTLQETILNHASRAYRGLIVSSGLARSASFQIPITGQVVEPGIVAVNGLARLSEALTLAGGVAPTGSSSDIQVIFIDGDSTVYNINEFTINGNLDSNPLMQRNSRIHVPAATANIVIEGALSRGSAPHPSGYSIPARVLFEFIPGETARGAVVRAGGLSESANPDECYVYRMDADSATIMLPFSMYDTSTSVLLQTGDKIVVPSEAAYITVIGQVVSTLPVTYSPGMPVRYYIAMAGGFNDVANRNKIKLIQTNGLNTDISLTDIVPIGATIEVPRVPVKFWEEYLVILTGVATAVLAYQSLFSTE